MIGAYIQVDIMTPIFADMRRRGETLTWKESMKKMLLSLFMVTLTLVGLNSLLDNICLHHDKVNQADDSETCGSNGVYH